MRTLSQADMLSLWEHGLSQDSLQRTFTMLRLAGSEQPEQLAVGESERHLLELRHALFGPEISAVAHCPECNAALELNFTVADVMAEPGPSSEQVAFRIGEYEVSVRVLKLQDLKDARDAKPGDIQRFLLERCVVGVNRGGKEVGALPEELVPALSQRMSEADPQAETRLALHCAECRHLWSDDFEIEPFIWAELQAWASRTFLEVHQLAVAYGWSEQQVLSLSPIRRNIYLNLATE